jgi:hypothetical protein
MADLDYTNIAGSPFQPYVATQIEKRKKLIDNKNRSSQELQWLTNKNVWIRVSSGANVLYGNKRFGGLEGDALSKKYILQAGLVDHTGGPTSFNLRSGLGDDGAYGIGKTDTFGFKPMPGITGISIKTGGKLGTLKETTIDFVCYNMEQLNIMEALYMKLGFGLLVEWGHTFYIANDTGKIENTPLPIGFYGIHTKEKLMEEITANRIKHSGNYDATWGTIKNFTYSLADNGSFKCQVQLVGAGDILESLKINLSGEFRSNISSSSEITSSIYPVVADQNQSLLNSALFKIYQNEVLNSSNVTGALIDFGQTYISWLDYIFKGHISVSNWASNSELVRKGFHYRLLNKPGMNTPHTVDIDTNVPTIESYIGTPSAFFSRLIMGYEINGEGLSKGNDINSTGLEQVYITLGHLLLLIKYTGMLLQKNNEKDIPKPYIYIDVNPETNRCYTFPGHCSLDPSVCLIGSEKLPFGITSDIFSSIQVTFPFYGDNKNSPGIGDADLGGKFMYTLVNIDWVASILKKWRTADQKGNVYFVDLVKDILEGISKATGGYNEFRIVPDDDSRCIRILDDRRVSSLTQTVPTYTQIPVLGLKSLAYNFNYTSKISPNTAAMVVIAAQAQPYGVQGAENALSFSHLNKGLYNRLDTITVDAATNNNATAKTNDSSNQRYIELRDFIEKLYDGVGTGALAETEIQQTEIQQNVFGDNLPPIIPKVNKDNFKDKLRGSLEAAINELKIIAQNSKEDASKEIAALDKAKAIILSSPIANDFENYKTLEQSDQKDMAEINTPKSSMYAYITLQLNANYDSPSSLFDDSPIEKLWQNKLGELNEYKQNADLK